MPDMRYFRRRGSACRIARRAMEWRMKLLWRAGTPTIGFLGVLAVVGTAGLWGSFVAPAMAQNTGASPPEVSVDLDVLNSLDHGPAPSGGNVTLHPPRERDDVASDREPGPTPSRRPGRRAKASTGTRAATRPAPTASSVFFHMRVFISPKAIFLSIRNGLSIMSASATWCCRWWR